MTISVVVRSTVHQQQFQLPSPCALADLVLDDETCPFTEVDVHLRKEGVNSSWGQPVLVNVRNLFKPAFFFMAHAHMWGRQCWK